jgi:hypothetical protein
MHAGGITGSQLRKNGLLDRRCAGLVETEMNDALPHGVNP